MDIILESFDTLVFDAIWAHILPLPQSQIPRNGTNATLDGFETCVVLTPNDYFGFAPGKFACSSQWPRDDWRRQLLTLFVVTWLFDVVIYFVFATLSYLFVFDKTVMNHPKFLKNQISLEIKQATATFPVIAMLTAPIFLLEVRGYLRLYDKTWDGPGLWYNFLQFPLFLFFTDYCIYWIHRYLHHPMVYKRLHKPHHKWIVPTPFASHAFHPLDGYAQGLPYHVFAFLFPLQKFAYIALFIFINLWTIMIHDGEYVADNPIINGAACHTMHHLYFNFNYGQFTTLWDRLGGSYRKPNDELFRKELKMCKTEWNKQAQEMEKIAVEVEGENDRVYLADEKVVVGGKGSH